MTTTYDLGLALSGGSIKGFLHLGVLKYMDEHGIKPEIIAGTSAGSIMGAFYASGYSPEEILELLSRSGFMQMTSLQATGGGLFSMANFFKFLCKNLPYKHLEDLPIPMRIVASDIDAGEQQIFTEGSLPKIVLASCSIPILFQPVEIDGRTYLDGGLYRNFPVTVIKEDCQRVIGVNLGPVQAGPTPKTFKAIANRTWELVFRQNTAPDRDACDYLIEISLAGKYGMFDLDAAEPLMALGYELATTHLSALTAQP